MSDGGEPRALQRHGHAAVGAVAVLGRRGDVVGVAGQAVADDLGIDLGAARLGVLQLFENDDAGALAHDEAVAVAVIGPRGFLGRVVAVGGKRPAGGEAGKRKPADRRFRAAGHHDVGIAEDDQPRRVADGMRAGRAGGNDSVVRALELVADRHLAGDQVDDVAGNEERADAARAAFLQDDARFRRCRRYRQCRSRSSRRWRTRSASVSGFQPESASASSAAAIP